MFGWFRKPPALESYADGVSRDVLIQSGRILFVDDEVMSLIDELKRAGFAVNHDATGQESEQQVAAQVFDVAILDYSGIGGKFGSKEGLDLMRHIRRISPRTRIIAYTSKVLGSDKSDFFRMADAVLAKDAGVTESLDVVEAQLQKAFSKAHLYEALLKSLDVSSPSKRIELKSAIEKGLKSKDQSSLRSSVKRIAGATVDKGIDILLNKLFVE
jgi:CheY-like chemotaxis protein